jgi:hypothetical protein
MRVEFRIQDELNKRNKYVDVVKINWGKLDNSFKTTEKSAVFCSAKIL